VAPLPMVHLLTRATIEPVRGGALRRIIGSATADEAHGRAMAARSPLPGADVHNEDEGSGGCDQDS
jgi:hypothetical protein